jgi:hypothetical protein
LRVAQPKGARLQKTFGFLISEPRFCSFARSAAEGSKASKNRRFFDKRTSLTRRVQTSLLQSKSEVCTLRVSESLPFFAFGEEGEEGEEFAFVSGKG